MNERQIKALNNLYVATVEVMNAFAPEMVTAEMRRETLARVLDNFLSGMSETRGSGVENPGLPIATDGNSGKTEGGNTVITGPSDPPVPLKSDSQITKGEERYTTVPKNHGFKTLKKEEDKAEILNSDPETIFFYKFYITGDTGKYEIAPLDENQVKEFFARGSELLEGVAEVVPGSEKPENTKRIQTVELGEVVKDGRTWKVVRPVKIKYVS